VSERFETVRRRVAWLRSKGLYDLASIYGSIAAEPRDLIRLARSSATPTDLIDPPALTQDQQLLGPILFVHGKWGNPGQFAPLLAKLSELGRPFFSVSLVKRGRYKQRDFNAFWSRIEEIRALYPEEKKITIDVVGYSRGAEVVSQSAFDEVPIDGGKQLKAREGIGRVVLVGSPLSSRLPEGTDLPKNLYEIEAEQDVLVKGRSILDESQRYLARGVGHCGLFLDDRALQQIANWLKSEEIACLPI